MAKKRVEELFLGAAAAVDRIRHLAQAGDHVFTVQAVIDLLAAALAAHNTGVFQDLQMVRDGRAGDLELLGNLIHIHGFTASQQEDDLDANGVADAFNNA